MLDIELKFKGKLLADPFEAAQIFHDDYLTGFENSLKTLRDYIRARCSIGASGHLRNSVSYSAKELTPRGPFGFATGPLEFEGVVYARSETEYHVGIFPSPWSAICPYARAVERGTRPHFPPVDQISPWAAHVLPISMTTEELSTAAFFIARAISRRGTRGRFMFRDGLRQFQTENVLANNMEKSIAIGIQKATAETPWWAAF